MRALVAGCLILCACNSDSFTGSDGGPDASGEAGGDAADRDSGAADATSSDGHAEDVVVQDVTTVDAIGTDASTGPYVQCDQANTQQCPAPSEVCCGNTYWTGSSCTPMSGCGNVSDRPLACDDITDCPSNEFCCAQVLTTSVLVVVNSYCATYCNQPQTQLCRGTAECKTGSCVPLPNGSSPTWLEHCQ